MAPLYTLLSLYAVAFLSYALTAAFTYDETYHLLAAQLIGRGQRPYLDFCFPQTPLNAYWNALWMRLLGAHWRVPHALAALLTIAAVFLTADYVFRRFPVPAWRLAAAAVAGLAFGLNSPVFVYGAVSAYGMALFALVAAFRISVRAVERPASILFLASGLCAGAAAASSLLTAAATPVLLLWMLYYHRAGRRTTLLAFTAGAAVPFAPVFRLLWLGPQQTWFNLVQYHAHFRKLYWPETTSHDLEVLTSWTDSAQAMLLGVLAAVGLFYIVRRTAWPAAVKAELYLCAWLAAALSTELALAHPTFSRYFLLTVPFLAILAAAGWYALAAPLFPSGRPLWPALLLVALLVPGLARTLYDRREDDTWAIWERLAKNLDSVAPPYAPVYADEPIYFLTRRVPPPGFEQSYSHKVDLGRSQNALLHIVTEQDIERDVRAGKFAAALSCRDYETEQYAFAKVYRRQLETDTCVIFWDPAHP